MWGIARSGSDPSVRTAIIIRPSVRAAITGTYGHVYIQTGRYRCGQHSIRARSAKGHVRNNPFGDSYVYVCTCAGTPVQQYSITPILLYAVTGVVWV